ncbi:hypothetical protein HK096_001488, partial [Nowakowskiella sp. JEL0078]
MQQPHQPNQSHQQYNPQNINLTNMSGYVPIPRTHFNSSYEQQVLYNYIPQPRNLEYGISDTCNDIYTSSDNLTNELHLSSQLSPSFSELSGSSPNHNKYINNVSELSTIKKTRKRRTTNEIQNERIEKETKRILKNQEKMNKEFLKKTAGAEKIRKNEELEFKKEKAKRLVWTVDSTIQVVELFKQLREEHELERKNVVGFTSWAQFFGDNITRQKNLDRYHLISVLTDKQIAARYESIMGTAKKIRDACA